MTEPARTTPPVPAAGLCPRCAAPFDAEQEYCLECGLRLPWDNPVFARVAARATGRYPWLPRDWLWPSLAALAFAVAGAALAIVLTREDGSGAAALSTAIGGNPIVVETATLPTAPERTGTSNSPPATTTRPAARPNPLALVEWPRGRDGWTIVLISLPQTGGAKAAREKGQEAVRRGLPKVGVIDSNRFPSLHAGYYVVFTGIYDSPEEAAGALRQAKAVFRAAYTRQISA